MSSKLTSGLLTLTPSLSFLREAMSSALGQGSRDPTIHYKVRPAWQGCGFLWVPFSQGPGSKSPQEAQGPALTGPGHLPQVEVVQKGHSQALSQEDLHQLHGHILAAFHRADLLQDGQWSDVFLLQHSRAAVLDGHTSATCPGKGWLCAALGRSTPLCPTSGRAGYVPPPPLPLLQLCHSMQQRSHHLIWKPALATRLLQLKAEPAEGA